MADEHIYDEKIGAAASRGEDARDDAGFGRGWRRGGPAEVDAGAWEDAREETAAPEPGMAGEGGFVRGWPAGTLTYLDSPTSGYVIDEPGAEGGRWSAPAGWASSGAPARDLVDDARTGASEESDWREPEVEAAEPPQASSSEGPAPAGEDVPEPYPYPGVARGRRAAWIAVFVLALVAIAMTVYACTTGVLGFGRAGSAAGTVGTAAGTAAGQVLDAVVAAGVDARDEAVDGGWLATKTVCIDAGHGATADLTLTPIGPGSSEMQYVEPGGASGIVTGRGEYQVALEVALLLQAKLEDAGVNVVMVRTTNDVVLSSEERAEVANECGADVFLRLHADGADDSSVHGFSTLIPGPNQWTEDIVEPSAYAAQIIHPIVIAETGANDRGIVERTDLAGFNFCEVPSLLFEMGYMSNPDEDRLLSDPEYQDLLATAICDGTIAYLEATS